MFPHARPQCPHALRIIGVTARGVTSSEYNAGYFWQMVCEKGGLQTAKHLIHTEQPSEGFSKLWELKRLDLSVEAHVIKPEYKELFTDAEQQICLARLEEYGYTP